MTEAERAAVQALTWEQIRDGDPDASRLISAVVPILQVIPARSHAQAFAMLFGMLMAEMRPKVADFNFEDQLEFFGIIARTTYLSALTDEASRVQSQTAETPATPRLPGTLLRMVPKPGADDANSQEVPESESGDALDPEDDPDY